MPGRGSSIILDLATWPTDYIYNLVSRSRRGAYDAWIVRFSIVCYRYVKESIFSTKSLNKLNRIELRVCSRRKFEIIL